MSDKTIKITLTGTQAASLITAAGFGFRRLDEIDSEWTGQDRHYWVDREYDHFDGRSIRRLEDRGLVESREKKIRGCQYKTYGKITKRYPQAKITRTGFLVASAIIRAFVKRDPNKYEKMFIYDILEDLKEHDEMNITLRLGT